MLFALKMFVKIWKYFYFYFYQNCVEIIVYIIYEILEIIVLYYYFSKLYRKYSFIF